MFRYLRLRMPQIMLILSITLPLALVFSLKVSASGFFDAGMFWTIFSGSTAALWGVLAIYTRDIDRKRQLPDDFMTYVNCGNTCVSMKASEKADITRQLLQDDALFRKQTRVWWRMVGITLRKTFIRTPAVLLGAVCLVFWFSPESVMAVIAGIHSGAVACQVYAAGNFLLIAYIFTGCVVILSEVSRNRDNEIVCFTPAYQERVREFAQAHQKASVAERADSTTRQEAVE